MIYIIDSSLSHYSTINRQDIQSYIATHYTPNRMVLAAAGGVEHEALVELAEQYFGTAQPLVAPMQSAPDKFMGREVIEMRCYV